MEILVISLKAPTTSLSLSSAASSSPFSRFVDSRWIHSLLCIASGLFWLTKLSLKHPWEIQFWVYGRGCVRPECEYSESFNLCVFDDENEIHIESERWVSSLPIVSYWAATVDSNLEHTRTWNHNKCASSMRNGTHESKSKAKEKKWKAHTIFFCYLSCKSKKAFSVLYRWCVRELTNRAR